MLHELKDSLYSLIKDLDTMAEVKKVFKGNDVSGALADELLARWKAGKSGEPAVAYPAKTLTTETKVVEAPVEKTEEAVAEEPETVEPEAIDMEPVSTTVEEPIAVAAPAPRIFKK